MSILRILMVDEKEVLQRFRDPDQPKALDISKTESYLEQEPKK